MSRLRRRYLAGLPGLRVSDESRPDWVDELAAYNTRRSQGIVHTPEYEARMAALQVEFDRMNAERGREEAGHDHG